MRTTVKRVFLALCVLAFLASVGVLVLRAIDAQRAEEINSQAKADAAGVPAQPLLPTAPKPAAAPEGPAAPDAPETPEETPAPPEPDPQADALFSTDLAALRETNPDVIGWIRIPDTVIDYPVLQAEDNQYYLRRTWLRTRNNAGSIFMECTNAPDLSGFSTILYGHRMKNDTMFGSLRFYKNQTYLMEHPCVYIATDAGVYRYRVYAAYEAGVRSETYHLEFPTNADKLAFISFGFDNSKVASGILPGVNDRILTLSTCTGTGYSSRWVVQAVLDGVFLPEE